VGFETYQSDEEDIVTRLEPKRPGLTLTRALDELRACLPELRQRYGVVSLGVFGSYVRSEQRQGSDLDVLVEFDDRPLTLLQFIALENELSDRLGVKVDLVEKSCLKPGIGRHVLKEVVTL
jgi:predicted nucleotidyltransferase